MSSIKPKAARSAADQPEQGEENMAIRKARKKSRRKAKARRRRNPAKSRQRRSAAQKRASLKNLKKAQAKRKGKRKASGRKRKGQTAKQRAASLRNIKKAQAARRGRKGRKGKRRSKSVGLKFARKTRRNVKRVKRSGTKRAKSFAIKHRMRSNPGAMLDAVKGVLPIAGAFYGTKFVTAKLANVGPVGGLLAKLPMGGKLAGPVLSGVVLAGVHYGTKKGALAKHRSNLMLGSAFALLDATFSAFAPASVASQFGVQAVGGYFPTSEYVPQSEYIAQSDYVAMSDYEMTDQSPRQLHEVWGVHGIEEELGSDYGSLQSSW